MPPRLDRPGYRRRRLAAGLAACTLALVACGGDDDGAADVGGGATVPPLALPGPHAVACSNVAQDFARVANAAGAEDYWEGKPAADGTPRYVGDLLTEPAAALSVTVTAPADATRFGPFAGSRVDYVVIACHPTAADNPRPDFALPNGESVPHMQVGGDAPLFEDPAARYAVIAFSHGLAASPLSDDHFAVLKWLASYGYVVVAPFHGDPRIADLRIDDFGDAVTLLSHLDRAVAMQALRPLALSAALDLLLSDPQWSAHVDAARIGGFGASLGGETMLLLGGAALTTSPGLASSPVGADPRIRAAVGYVPYFGQPLLPAFGRDQEGLADVALPYLAIGGTADTTAPLSMTQRGLAQLDGPRRLVVLVGGEHRFEAAAAGDILTWSLTFLDAEVKGLSAARERLAGMTRVEGGGDDRLVDPVDGPLP